MVGSLESETAWCRHVCNKTDIVIVDVNYRKGPEFPFPAAIYDSWAAVKWVRLLISCDILVMRSRES